MDAYSDHLPSFKKLLEVVDTKTYPKRLLEFGLGNSTFELLKMFDHVHSVELYSGLLVPKDWFNNVSKKLENDPKWSGELVEMPETLRKVEDEIRVKGVVNNRVWDAESQLGQDIKEIVVNAINSCEPDIVFIDAGSHCRGEIARYLMDNHMDFPANFIVIHDTNWGDLRYGYNNIIEGNNGDTRSDWITRQYFKDGSGTKIYMRSSNAVKKYREQKNAE